MLRAAPIKRQPYRRQDSACEIILFFLHYFRDSSL
jgi:hypothetical protein